MTANILLFILWALGSVFLFIAAFVTAIVCLLLKERAQHTAINVLMLVVTLSVAMGLAANYLPKDLFPQSKRARAAFKLDYARQAEMSASSLAETKYIDKMSQPWMTLNRMDGVPTYADALDASEKTLRKLLDDYPHSAAVASRLAVVVHEKKGDAAKVLREFAARRHRSLAIVSALQDAFGIEHGQTVAHDENESDAGESSEEAGAKSEAVGQSAEDVLIACFPDDYYRREALRSLYQRDANDADKLKSLNAQEDELCRRYQQNLAAYESLRCTFIAVGLFVLALASRATSAISLVESVAISFRQVYGSMLGMIYAQQIAGTVIGIIIGFIIGFTSGYARVHGGKAASIGNVATLSQEIICTVATVATLWCVYFIVCRPARISLSKLFDSELSRQPLLLVLTSLKWFCALVAVNSCIRWIVQMLPLPKGMGNEAQIQMGDAVASGNPVHIALFVLMFCLAAPVVEELVFRGLLYPWLRKRWAMAAAMLGSAALFAFWHLDMLGFFQYFGIGLILAFAYERTRSLTCAVLIHGLWNGWVIILTAWLAAK